MMKRLEKWRDVIEKVNQSSVSPVSWDDLVKQNIVLFERDESVMLCNLCLWRDEKVMHITVAAGKMQDINEMYLEAENFAKQQGCLKITYAGRFGWLKTHGFKELAVIGCKELI